MRRDERIRRMLKHDIQMVERLKLVDLSKLSERQLKKLEKTLEELEEYVLLHVKDKK